MAVSSANSASSVFGCLGRSFMKYVNRVEASRLPCGTPAGILNEVARDCPVLSFEKFFLVVTILLF